MPTKEWKADLEARATQVYADKEVFIAAVERTLADIEQSKRSFVKLMDRCIATYPSIVAIDWMNKIKAETLEEQRSAMRKGYTPMATDEDRVLAEETVTVLNFFVEIIDTYLARLNGRTA